MPLRDRIGAFDRAARNFRLKFWVIGDLVENLVAGWARLR